MNLMRFDACGSATFESTVLTTARLRWGGCFSWPWAQASIYISIYIYLYIYFYIYLYIYLYLSVYENLPVACPVADIPKSLEMQTHDLSQQDVQSWSKSWGCRWSLERFKGWHPSSQQHHLTKCTQPEFSVTAMCFGMCFEEHYLGSTHCWEWRCANNKPRLIMFQDLGESWDLPMLAK